MLKYTFDPPSPLVLSQVEVTNRGREDICKLSHRFFTWGHSYTHGKINVYVFLLIYVNHILVHLYTWRGNFYIIIKIQKLLVVNPLRLNTYCTTCVKHLSKSLVPKIEFSISVNFLPFIRWKPKETDTRNLLYLFCLL